MKKLLFLSLFISPLLATASPNLSFDEESVICCPNNYTYNKSLKRCDRSVTESCKEGFYRNGNNCIKRELQRVSALSESIPIYKKCIKKTNIETRPDYTNLCGKIPKISTYVREPGADYVSINLSCSSFTSTNIQNGRFAYIHINANAWGKLGGAGRYIGSFEAGKNYNNYPIASLAPHWNGWYKNYGIFISGSCNNSTCNYTLKGGYSSTSTWYSRRKYVYSLRPASSARLSSTMFTRSITIPNPYKKKVVAKQPSIVCK